MSDEVSEIINSFSHSELEEVKEIHIWLLRHELESLQESFDSELGERISEIRKVHEEKKERLNKLKRDLELELDNLRSKYSTKVESIGCIEKEIENLHFTESELNTREELEMRNIYYIIKHCLKKLASKMNQDKFQGIELETEKLKESIEAKTMQYRALTGYLAEKLIKDREKLDSDENMRVMLQLKNKQLEDELEKMKVELEDENSFFDKTKEKIEKENSIIISIQNNIENKKIIVDKKAEENKMRCEISEKRLKERLSVLDSKQIHLNLKIKEKSEITKKFEALRCSLRCREAEHELKTAVNSELETKLSSSIAQIQKYHQEIEDIKQMKAFESKTIEDLKNQRFENQKYRSDMSSFCRKTINKLLDDVRPVELEVTARFREREEIGRSFAKEKSRIDQLENKMFRKTSKLRKETIQNSQEISNLEDKIKALEINQKKIAESILVEKEEKSELQSELIKLSKRNKNMKKLNKMKSENLHLILNTISNENNKILEENRIAEKNVGAKEEELILCRQHIESSKCEIKRISSEKDDRRRNFLLNEELRGSKDFSEMLLDKIVDENGQSICFPFRVNINLETKLRQFEKDNSDSYRTIEGLNRSILRYTDNNKVLENINEELRKKITGINEKILIKANFLRSKSIASKILHEELITKSSLCGSKMEILKNLVNQCLIIE
ncbi:MAG: hypothetical protein MHMPM18_001468 [Marteilia pararefringens]